MTIGAYGWLLARMVWIREFDLINVVEGWDSKDEVVRAVLGAAFRVVREDRRSAEASIEYPRISLPSALVRKFLI